MNQISFIKDISIQWGGYGSGTGPGMMGWGYGMGWLWIIINIAFWIAIIVGIIFLVKWLATSSKQQAKSEDSAVEILRKRYARGEINREEFEERKRDLEK